MPRINCQPDIFNLGSWSKEDGEDAFLSNRHIDNSSDKYIDQFMDNPPSHLDPPILDIFMVDNLSDEHNQIDFKALSKRKQVTYVVDVVRRLGFPSFANTFIVQLHNFTRV